MSKISKINKNKDPEKIKAQAEAKMQSGGKDITVVADENQVTEVD